MLTVIGIALVVVVIAVVSVLGPVLMSLLGASAEMLRSRAAISSHVCH